MGYPKTSHQHASWLSLVRLFNSRTLFHPLFDPLVTPLLKSFIWKIQIWVTKAKRLIDKKSKFNSVWNKLKNCNISYCENKTLIARENLMMALIVWNDGFMTLRHSNLCSELATILHNYSWPRTTWPTFKKLKYMKIVNTC